MLGSVALAQRVDMKSKQAFYIFPMIVMILFSNKGQNSKSTFSFCQYKPPSKQINEEAVKKLHFLC